MCTPEIFDSALIMSFQNFQVGSIIHMQESVAKELPQKFKSELFSQNTKLEVATNYMSAIFVGVLHRFLCCFASNIFLHSSFLCAAQGSVTDLLFGDV